MTELSIKILIDKKMKKKDLMAVTDINASTMAKMGKDLLVSMDVLGRICKSLGCDIGDIVEMIPENTDNK
jgi:DNA-binding Xre family transcriptional regulator